MLRVLPPMFKPVNNLICCKTFVARHLLQHRYSTRLEAMLQDKWHDFVARFSVP